jgi:hypothetical protein
VLALPSSHSIFDLRYATTLSVGQQLRVRRREFTDRNKGDQALKKCIAGYRQA